MQYLIACDLEGVHGVVGEPYVGLGPGKAPEQYKLAVENAALEINTAAKALYDNGADLVVLWDNHGMGKNIDPSTIDPRIQIVDHRQYRGRMGFAVDYNFAGVVYIGYHPMEGTLGGVLAHTYNSTTIQYIKVDGKAVGELSIDSWVAGNNYGIPAIFAASDDKAIAEFKQISPDGVGVITKYGKSRNEAELRPREEVLEEIYNGVVEAMKKKIAPATYPVPANFEIRYTRMEAAADVYTRLGWQGAVEHFEYGEDAHILQGRVANIADICKL